MREREGETKKVRERKKTKKVRERKKKQKK